MGMLDKSLASHEGGEYKQETTEATTLEAPQDVESQVLASDFALTPHMTHVFQLPTK